LTGPAHHVPGELGERCGPFAERGQGCDGTVAKLRRALFRRLESHGARIGRLAFRGVRAGGLAEHGRITLDVQNVVLDLECEPDVAAESRQSLPVLTAVDSSGGRAEEHAAGDERTRLAGMHVFYRGGIE